MAGRIDVCLLGGVEVTASDAPVAMSGPKLKAIVAMLALGAPHPVSHEKLIDEIWADEPVTNPANALQAQISALRRLLGRDAVERRGPGYVLAVGPDDVDTIRLERLVRAGREAANAGDHHLAAQQHKAALALVRGPALDGIAHYRFARDAAIWLDELILGSQEGLMDALLATGAHDEVVAALSGLVRTHAMRERLHAQLILALYRCGRQADALRAYQEARQVLLDELGVDPGPELQALEQAILSHDPSLDLAATPAVPRPVATADATPVVPGRLPLFGRDREVAELRGDLDAARAGRGRTTVLGGEPGIGKTRVVEEMSDFAEAHGMAVAWGRCFEGRGAPSFWPWTQIIRSLLTRFEPDELRAALAWDAAELAQIVPEVKELVADYEPPPPLDPESAKFRLCQAVFGFLDRLARTRPVLVVVDDLHWADASSLDVLTFMASEMFDTPLLVLGTFRNIDPSLGGDLAQALADLSRRSVARRMDLEGLDVAGLAALLEAAGAASDAARVDRVYRRTGGNPFFVRELVSLLPTEEERVAAAKAEEIAYGETVPASVKGVIQQRAARLPDATMGTLRVAAALGQDFDLSVLAATIEADGATLLEHLEPAIEAGLVIDNLGGTTRYRFSHGLVNETIYDDLGAATRARTHLRIAQALEVHHGDSDGPHLLATATHWFHAVPAADAKRGIETAVRAAHWAQAHVAHHEAEAQLRCALELIAGMPEGRERSTQELAVQDQLCLLLITATSYTDPEFGRVCARVRELCHEVDDQDLMVPALWRLGVNHFMRSEIEEGFALARDLLELEAEDTTAAQVAGNIMMALVHHEAGDQVAARPFFDRAIELCDEADDSVLNRFVMEDPPAFVRFFSSLNWWLLGDEEQAEREAVESFAIASQKGMGAWATMISFWSSSTLAVLRRQPEVTIERADIGLELAKTGGYGLGIPYIGVNRGWALAAEGDTTEGCERLLEGAAIAQAFGAEYMRPAFAALHAEVCCMDGRPDDALAAIEGGFAAVEATGERWFEAELHRTRGVAILAAGGDQDEARAAFTRAIEVATAQGSLAFARRAEADLEQAGR